MSAFSRGFTGFLHQNSLRLPYSIRVAIFSARTQPLRPQCGARFFSPASFRPYARLSGLPQSSRNSVAPSYGSFISMDPVLRMVEATKAPVLLYKAPQRRLYMAGVYALACGLVAGGLFTLRWRYELPKDLPFFVGPTYVLVGFIMLAIGAYIFTAPVHRCVSLEVIPSAFGGPVQLRITTRFVPIPYISKDKVIIANIGEATLSEKTLPVVRELLEADRARKADISEGLKGVFIIRRWWEMLARLTEQKWTSFFNRFKFAVLRFGIVFIDVQGGKYKIDCTGYMRENGKAIDRLISEI
ncbi:hypothetical protein K469DRAFT_717336 [Zopfia rhizophila CBS 207.26]|uniref:Uncharacterized protein n=1 Tax=Zopfia rhizophila CBS 207.26 TaxID=1314779 RepID=A0A6A6ENI8_9PEZI|nr:hypothetical protein K469DRAFT_717336 [Zopfia rhizophila CBS 207.26]